MINNAHLMLCYASIIHALTIFSKAREEPSLAFGGQAILEGVMIRSRKHMVTCVRRQNGEILTITEEIKSLSNRYRVLKLPFIRGILALFETLYLGVKSLFLSANIALEEEGETLTNKEIAITMVMIIALTSFFIVVPFLLTTSIKFTGVTFNIVEAVVRLLIFLTFLKLVSLWDEYKRVLQYHGAEHKAINAYEARVPLNLSNVKRFSTLHPRCGTSFILIVTLVSILLFSIIPNLTLLERLAYRVILIPVIGSLSYELLRFSSKYKNSKIMKVVVMPGLRLQRLTTKEPDDDMIVVALKAINEVNRLRKKNLRND